VSLFCCLFTDSIYFHRLFQLVFPWSILQLLLRSSVDYFTVYYISLLLLIMATFLEHRCAAASLSSSVTSRCQSVNDCVSWSHARFAKDWCLQSYVGEECGLGHHCLHSSYTPVPAKVNTIGSIVFGCLNIRSLINMYDDVTELSRAHHIHLSYYLFVFSSITN